ERNQVQDHHARPSRERERASRSAPSSELPPLGRIDPTCTVRQRSAVKQALKLDASLCSFGAVHVRPWREWTCPVAHEEPQNPTGSWWPRARSVYNNGSLSEVMQGLSEVTVAPASSGTSSRHEPA